MSFGENKLCFLNPAQSPLMGKGLKFSNSFSWFSRIRIGLTIIFWIYSIPKTTEYQLILLQLHFNFTEKVKQRVKLILNLCKGKAMYTLVVIIVLMVTIVLQVKLKEWEHGETNFLKWSLLGWFQPHVTETMTNFRDQWNLDPGVNNKAILAELGVWKLSHYGW